ITILKGLFFKVPSQEPMRKLDESTFCLLNLSFLSPFESSNDIRVMAKNNKTVIDLVISMGKAFFLKIQKFYNP
ncbi:MAG: hypothetical protein ACK438_10065, partial [Flavobacteriales bacterium]